MNYPNVHFDDANIDTLQTALNSACDELGISKDRKKCEVVASLIFRYARTGQADMENLKSYAVERFECSL